MVLAIITWIGLHSHKSDGLDKSKPISHHHHHPDHLPLNPAHLQYAPNHSYQNPNCEDYRNLVNRINSTSTTSFIGGVRRSINRHIYKFSCSDRDFCTDPDVTGAGRLTRATAGAPAPWSSTAATGWAGPAPTSSSTWSSTGWWRAPRRSTSPPRSSTSETKDQVRSAA